MSESDKPTLLVIDGHSLAFRAFYALPVDSFQTSDGQHTNAIHGFLSMLLLLLQREKPTHIAVAFDISRHSFRTREYPEYKGTRSETPNEFVGQVPLLQDALTAMNIVTLTKEDFEADDILATLARQGREQGFNVLVCSGDRDTIQLVGDDVTLLYPSGRQGGVSDLKRYDTAAVRERYGIEPAQYPDVAALVGESSDNLIGIDKVGEKTAVKWLGLYGSLAGILEHADEIKGVVGNNLREQRERAERNRRLNRLIDDVELEVGPKDLERKPIDERAVRDLFARLEFRTLLERVMKLEGGGDQSSASTVEGAIEQEPSTAPPAPAPQTELLDEELAAWLDRQHAANPDGLGLTVETTGGQLTGIGIAGQDESVLLNWIPGRADYAPVERWLASDRPKVLHDAKAQLKVLRGAGLELDGIAFDTLVAAWLLRPSGVDKTLADVVQRYLGEVLPQADPNQLVPENDADTGPATTAWFTLRAVHGLREVLDDRDLRVLRDIEIPTLRVLASMELDGVAIDAELLKGLSADLSTRIDALASEAFEVLGHELNLGSPKQLQQVLFDELGMPKTRATKTGYSTDADSLADLMDKNPHPFLDLLLQHRDASKLRQIIETLERGIGSDGRIHTTYVQTGTTTGRISSNDPNLQNIPIRADEGRRMRAAFVHGPKFQTLLTADYSQIEMRIMAHLSGDAGLIEAFHGGEDLHRFVGSRVFGVDPSDVTPGMRTKVKAMSYGLAYGLSAFGLSKQLRIDTSEARQLMTDYFDRFGAVRDYLRNVVEQARADGYTETIHGRRRPFPDLNSPNRVLRDNAERAALNAPIQGSAADIMKLAMIAIDADMRARELESRMLLQVHDELVFEVADGEGDAVEEIVTARMGDAAELRVPLEVQVGHGANWDDAAH
ncbi:DNA polymerase I [Herbiconiux sp. L3-i23]|uniref:DNA polymerase I n=1 Tax=Herbiconiux sp. L3-i23 TaxID=2905871 RepID=UPI00206D344B|nr:DNA polymerase I [Herbiconiux sp. L3-i23]BDI22751.1 DNA polymerase I [Herbiconiux sp. L3-i23]